MKIFFDHLFGNTTEYDVFNSFAVADVDAGEEDQALAQGWTPMDAYFYTLDKLLWINVRTTRLCLQDWTWRKKHRRLKKNGVTHKFIPIGDPNPYNSECDKVYHAYCKFKRFTDHTGHVVESDFGNKDHFIYFDKDKVIGYSAITRFKESVIAGEFAWDYSNPNLQIGNYSVNIEAEHYKDMGIKHYYNSYAYQSICQYKCNFNNFEWWTGRQWSTDKDLYKTLLEKDDQISTFADLHQHTKEYFKLLGLT